MIEAVNSVLSNASVTSRVAEQQSASKSYAANPDKIQEVPKTPYISPYISIDRQSNKAVLQIRDSDTGDVVNQYPTQGQLKAYIDAQRASARAERREAIKIEQPNVGTSARTEVSVPSISAESSAVSTPTAGSVDTEA